MQLLLLFTIFEYVIISMQNWMDWQNLGIIAILKQNQIFFLISPWIGHEIQCDISPIFNDM